MFIGSAWVAPLDLKIGAEILGRSEQPTSAQASETNGAALLPPGLVVSRLGKALPEVGMRQSCQRFRPLAQ